ncbi:MAG: hypothetical protein WBE46_08070 [Dehalococcoidia bacterium]
MTVVTKDIALQSKGNCDIIDIVRIWFRSSVTWYGPGFSLSSLPSQYGRKGCLSIINLSMVPRSVIVGAL